MTDTEGTGRLKDNEIRISVRNLVEFILRSGSIDNRTGGMPDPEAMQMGARLHRKIQKQGGSAYRAEVPLSGTFHCEDFDITVEGRADGIITNDDDTVTIDEIKGIFRSLEYLEEPVPVHLAQAKCYAYFYLRDKLMNPETPAKAPAKTPTKTAAEAPAKTPAKTSAETNEKTLAKTSAKTNATAEAESDTAVADNQTVERVEAQPTDSPEPRIHVQMTYSNLETEEIKYFKYEFDFSELEDWFLGILEEYKKWAAFQIQWRQTRQKSIKETEFPYEYRAGQRNLAAAVYRTIARNKRLFIQAPTGSGKTLATLFPAVKAMGEELGDKIFYLTARTIARTVAEEGFDLLRGEGLRAKSVTITAKEKICPLDETQCDPEHCPYANGHYDRINNALYELISTKDVFTRPVIEKAAEEFLVCPFELSLDLTVWSDAVICDYNYVFSPRAKLKRFFADGAKGDYLFLIDEAHNLVDRGRDMYSAALIKEDFLELKKAVKNADPKMAAALDRCNKRMLEFKRACEGAYQEIESIGTFPIVLMNLSTRMEDFLEKSENKELSEKVRELYFQIGSFLDTCDRLDECYVTYIEILSDGRFMLKLFCVDPSVNLSDCLVKGRATVFFSATLLPIDYYRKMLSRGTEDYAVYAESIFDRDRLKVMIGADTSSLYTRRSQAEYDRAAEYILRTSQARKGNYLVFFSSYKMLTSVADSFEKIRPEGTEVIRQTSGMREAEREEFLESFSEEREDTLIGMCVMGSIFGEGIDLRKDRLIGAIIVGTGLPMVCSEQQLLKDYYDRRGEDGFRYAYLCPGMNKVLQAAGRVIRTEEDCGVALLLDERFTRSTYRQMFPREWSDVSVCSLKNVADSLENFWNKF